MMEFLLAHYRLEYSKKKIINCQFINLFKKNEKKEAWILVQIKLISHSFFILILQ